MNRRCILFILLLCVLKTSSQSEEPPNYDYNYDHTSDDAVTDKEITTLVQSSSEISTESSQFTESTTLSTIALITDSSIETSTTSVQILESKDLTCPKSCKCSNAFNTVDCSHQNLVKIPKNIPHNTVQLILSNNLLTTLNVSDLINCPELEQLYLNRNKIETIVNIDEFDKLPSLHYIDLSMNALKPLQGNEFSKAWGLATLILTGNKDVASNVPIVQTQLKTLNLDNCSITQISDSFFQNLSNLVVLDLSNNPLDLNLNTKAFKYMSELRTMNIPTLLREVAIDLCLQLGVIDVIHLSSENYDISCFLLSTGNDFEETKIPYGQSTLAPNDNDGDDLYEEREKPPPKPRKKPMIPTKSESKESAVVEPVVHSSEQKISSISQNEGKTEKAINETLLKASVNESEQKQVNVPQHIINMLLIGLIAVTLVALLIGVFCRLDCCGIKTKCCRRRHNRAETEDRVQPHEDIPLNKI